MTDALLPTPSQTKIGRVADRRSDRRTRFRTVVALLCFDVLLYAFNGKLSGRSSSAPSDHALVGDIHWANCEENQDLECGTVIVPLDYRNVSAGTAKLALSRANATLSPRLGTLFFNPGGPGIAPLTFFSYVARGLQNATSGHYDLVTLDPRGIGKSQPKLNCFTRAEYAAITSKTSIATNVDVDITRLHTPETKESLRRQYILAQATWKAIWDRCIQRSGEQLQWMGSTSVARDFEFIATLLDGEDAPINFFGGSYGSTLGQYIANMFPKRVGRMYLTAVVEGTVWSHNPPHLFGRTFFEDIDEIYRKFTSQCADAGPSRCTLARLGEGGPSLQARVDHFISHLYDNPLPVPNVDIPGVLTPSHVRTFLFSAFFAPASWPPAAGALAAAINGDGKDILSELSDLGTDDDETDALANMIVTCLDGPRMEIPTADELIDETIRTLANVSKFLGAESYGCGFIPQRLRGADRFAGPFNATTRNTVILEHSLLDPSTPNSGAKRVAELMGKSARFLTLNGIGHIPLPSKCTSQIKRSYFVNGTLPIDGTVCDVDGEAFPP